MVAIAIVAGILMFMILIILHELGHFTAARKTGVKVLEFGVGIPPKICKLGEDKKGTEYTANIIPLGGFCRLKGEDPNDPDDFNAPDSFMSAKFWKKIVILLGGVTANFIVAWILFTIVFATGTQPLSIIPENSIKGKSESLLMPTYSYLEELGFLTGEKKTIPVVVNGIISGYIADDLGIQDGDTIMSINGTDIDATNISDVLKNLIGQEVNIEYKRGENILYASTVCPEENCVLGITYSSAGNLSLDEIKFSFSKAMLMGFKEIGAEWNLTFSSLGNVIKNAFSFDKQKVQSSLNSLSGPVGVIVVLKELMYSGDWTVYLSFAGMISLALAIFNILPIPALDGGRALSVIIQRVFRLKKEKYFTIEGYVNTVFFMILMALGIIVIFNDFKVRVGIDLLYPIKWLIQHIVSML